jgi:ribosome-associated protein
MTSLDDNKAQNIVHFDLAGKTSIADRMIVASGTSTRQVTSLAENLITKLKSVGLVARSEGKKQGDWVLVDAGDVIVHIFRPEVREFYNIERLWAATPVAKPAKPKAVAKKRAAPKAKKPAAKSKAAPKAKAKRKPAKK